jgi:hypothetical protein
MLQYSPPDHPARICETRSTARDVLADYAFSLPGVRPARRIGGRPLDLALSDADALGSSDAFFHGTVFGRFRSDHQTGIDLMLPTRPWSDAIRVGLARPIAGAALRETGMAAPVLVRPPRDPVEMHVVMELIESSWAYARGL